jgi:uncharacterized protein (TIGR02246 family)
MCTSPSAPEDDVSPEHLHVDFQDAFNRHDLEALVALYEPDALFASGGGTVHGTAAIREVFRGVLASHPTIDLRTLGVHRSRDLAMLHGKYVLHDIGPDGAPIHREGRNTEVVRLQPDGRWRYVIDDPSIPLE